MPELPEVETTRRAVAPFLVGQVLEHVLITAPRLRLPTPAAALLTGRTVTQLQRRAKYLLAALEDGHTLLMHLGMSGRLSVFPRHVAEPAGPLKAPVLYHAPSPPQAKHDHAIFRTPLAELRLNDPRRFGLLLRLPTATLHKHPLLATLGPEPLEAGFTATTLHQALQKKTTALKPTLMNPQVVVGVGNIYASESLFAAGIHPATIANRVSLAQSARLVQSIQTVLHKALQYGGSTLRDFRQPNGEAGYFQDEFQVYGRAGQPCTQCGSAIRHMVQAQRSSYWCPRCQPLRSVGRRVA
jgi:formamidopyrimidine-DNA glycosylase